LGRAHYTLAIGWRLRRGHFTKERALSEAFWEHFHHRADIGVRGIGRSLAEAFEQAALALTAVVTDPSWVTDEIAVDLQCEAPDEELLLADWLNAVVYQMATRRMLFARFQVRIRNHRLEATAWGEPVDPVRHQPAVEVKGATYTELRVAPIPGRRWLAQCVVDV
jgi:SHS2 domain-containing protein